MMYITYITAGIVLLMYSTKFFRIVDFKNNMIDPMGVFIIFYSLTYIILPIIQYKFDDFRYGINYSEGTLLYGLIYIIGFALITIGTYILLGGSSYKNSRFHILEWDSVSQKIKMVYLLIIVLSNIYVFTYFFKYIVSLGYSNYLVNRIVLLSGKGYLIFILMSIIPFTVFQAVEVFISRKTQVRSSKLVLIITFICAFLPSIVLGSRTNFVLPIVLILVSILVLTNKGKKISFRQAVLVFISLCFLLYITLFLQDYRQNLMLSGYEITNKDSVIKKISGGFGTAENIFWWHENNIDIYLMGKTLVSVLVGFIPRSIWVDKPFGGGPEFSNIIRPGSYDQSLSSITSYTTGLPFEFMMNFGFMGAVIGGVFFGFLLSVLSKVSNKINNSIQFTIWICLYYSIFSYLHGEFFGITSKIVIFLTLIFVIDILNKNTRKGSKK